MTVSFKIEGDKALAKKLRDLTKAFPKEFKDQVRESTVNIDRNAKKFAPVDTGRLRSSIRFEFRDNGLTGEVSANTIYAAVQEFGSAEDSENNIPPNPYLGPAFRLEASRFEDKLVDRIRKTLRGA